MIRPALPLCTLSAIQSLTLFLLPSPSTPTSNSSATVTTPNRLATPQTTSSSTSSASDADSSAISSVTSTTSATSTFSAAKKGLDASNLVVASGGWSPVAYTKALPDTLSTTMTSRSTTPALHNRLAAFASTSSTQSEATTHVSSAISSAYSPAPLLTHEPAALAAHSIWATYFTNHRDHGTGTSTSPLAPEPPSTSVPMSTPTFVSSIISGATASTESASHFHTFTRRPKFPHQFVSTEPDSVSVIIQPTQSRAILQTTMTLESVGPGSLAPIPTASSSVFPNNSSTSNSLVPLILGLVLGLLGIVALGVTFFRCRARRRSKYMSTALSCDSASSRERKDRMMSEETPREGAATSYRFPSAHSPEYITTFISHAGESFQTSNGHLSDPFADSSAIGSSPTSTPPASILSVDTVSTNMEFARSVNADTWDVGDPRRLVDASASSLELHFVAPLVARHDSSTQSRYLSPTWHYDGQSPTSSSRDLKEEEPGERCHGHVAPAPAKPFFLGTESTRLRLQALLKEARRA